MRTRPLGHAKPRAFPDLIRPDIRPAQKGMEMVMQHRATRRRQKPHRPTMGPVGQFLNDIKRIDVVVFIVLEPVVIDHDVPAQTCMELHRTVAVHRVTQKRELVNLFACQITQYRDVPYSLVKPALRIVEIAQINLIGPCGPI